MWPMNRILIICGPTATGKSALAVELAKQYNGEVISADSRQVYTGLDIGSAKITESEMDGIPHYLIDVVHPNDYFSVADFQKLAKEEINDIHSRGKLPIICGGTGMYIDALIYETNFPEVPANKPLRSELANLTNEELYAELQKLDPDRASEIDPHNSVRLIRAIEIATTLGSVPKITAENPQYETLWIGLDIPKEELEGKIKKRILDRIPALFEEINNLHLSGVSFERLESFGLEYRYGSYYVQEKITLEEFKDLLATKTWQYAKRQMTWFKRNKNIHWCNPIIDKQKILKLVQDFLK
jgi:tRNA dimethylallyltransferase